MNEKFVLQEWDFTLDNIRTQVTINDIFLKFNIVFHIHVVYF